LLAVNGNFTTQPVAAAWGADPEFVDLRGLKNIFGIGRSLAYRLIEHGDIRSVVLRRKGCIKGKRLINVESVRTHLAKLTEEAKESEFGDVDPRLSALTRKASRAMLRKRQTKR
jgi:hypothetical protein